MAVCIAVISKENYPLYLKTTEANSDSLSEHNLKYWYTIHTSLDVIDEKTKKSDFKDLYLGLLYLIEDFRIYGFVTSTHIKFLIIIETSNQQYHDTEIKIMFKKLHSAYINSVCNPFYEVGTTIKSKKFEELAGSLMTKNTVSSLMGAMTQLSMNTSQTQKQAEFTI